MKRKMSKLKWSICEMGESIGNSGSSEEKRKEKRRKSKMKMST